MSANFSAERTPTDNSSEKPIKERQLAAYYRALNYVEGCRLLEIGCGEGIGASLLATKAASVTAIDYSQEALRVARERFGRNNIDLALMKVPPIVFPALSYDAVVCFQMIEHLQQPEKLLVEIRRVLRGGGIALFATVNKDEVITENPYHLHEFAAREFEELLKSHFEAVEMYGVFGDELFMRYWQNNRKWASAFLRLDFLDLSAHLPRTLRQRLFDGASRLMRTRLKHRDPDLCGGITHDNFIFRPNEFVGCLDFFAVCRKTSAAG